MSKTWFSKQCPCCNSILPDEEKNARELLAERVIEYEITLSVAACYAENEIEQRFVDRLEARRMLLLKEKL